MPLEETGGLLSGTSTMNGTRASPFTASLTYGDDYLSARDKEGNEIGMIKTLKVFDEQTLIRKELERRYFVLTITHRPQRKSSVTATGKCKPTGDRGA